MAAPVTFHGFVATTVDAAYLVEAAALAGNLPLVDSAMSAADLGIPIQSGTVVVYRTQRWKDGRKWTDRRSLGNGFSVHREVSKDEAGRLTREEIVSALPVIFYYSCPSQCRTGSNWSLLKLTRQRCPHTITTPTRLWRDDSGRSISLERQLLTLG
jgi:hypothetical protein